MIINFASITTPFQSFFIEFIHNDRLDHGDEDLLINKEFIREFYEEKDDWKEQ